MNESPVLTGLYVYPIKSMPGIALTEARIERRGIQHDRRWLVVDAQGGQITARQHPRLLQARVSIETDHLEVIAPGMPVLTVPFQPEGVPRPVSVWADEMTAQSVSSDCAAWFSAYLVGDYDLVHMPETTQRWQEGNGKPYRALLSFADGNPFHLINAESVAALNDKLTTPVNVTRFRPNLVVSHVQPYAEDFWRLVTVGEVPFQVVESCDRCMMVNLSEEATLTAEPLRTLSRLRQTARKVPFGQHLVLDGWQPDWFLRVGDRVQVREAGLTPNPMY